MTKLLIKDGLLVTPTEERFTDILVEDDRIVSLGTNSSSDDLTEIDASDCYVTPGLIDIQVNGGPECDFWADLSNEKLARFSQRLLKSGTTCILPTLITGDIERLKKNRDFLKPELGLHREPSAKPIPLLRMPGLHFEGPCLSPTRPGVHPVEHLKPLELSVLKEFVDEACYLITLAPELAPDRECLKFLQEHGVLCAIGHSNATFEEANKAFDNGVSLMTHTFNALPAIHHRKPGAVVAALLDRRVQCCVIPDGLHLVPAMVEMVVALKGTDNTVLVTDMAAVGTSQGGLVGSSLELDEGIRNIVNWGIANFADAIRMATYNAAKLLNVADSIGHINPGAYADLLIWDRKTLALKQVIFNGTVLNQEAALHCV